MMIENHRSAERFSLQLEAKITHRHLEESPVIKTVVANISSGGAYIHTTHQFPVASKIQVEFLVDLESLQKLKFILSMDSLKSLANAQGKSLWVTTTAVVLRRDEEGIAIIFDKNYTVTAL